VFLGFWLRRHRFSLKISAFSAFSAVNGHPSERLRFNKGGESLNKCGQSLNKGGQALNKGG
jgi:hypothetical protein